MKKLIFVLVLLSIITCESFSQVISIDSVRVQDANGVPLLLNDTVTVVGIVTTQRELGSPLVYFQNQTAGLVAYDTLIGNHVNRGDSVLITGKVTHYNGLTELQPVFSYTLLSTGHTVTPVVVTPSLIRNSTGEIYEGRLIKINGITQVKTTAGVNATQWTTGVSGTNYRIFVGSDSCEIRIYTTTNIANTTIPAFPFSVVALNSQFDGSSPYTSGYQIIPRDLNDFTSQASGPQIVNIPFETNIMQTSVTLNWTTLNPGSGKIKYFVSDSIGQPVVYVDSILNADLTTNHFMTLSNLRPGKIYYATISSTDGTGTSTYTPKYFSTASPDGSTGKIETYFNYPVDTTVALLNNKANGSTDYKTRLIQLIDSAQYSIDLAIYSFDDITQIKDAIINAAVRQVKVRIVYDSRTNQALMQDLINAGFKVQKRNTATSALMHNKFFVFDGRDTSLHSKKWLWSGSANITSAQFYNDVQNVILIQDESLCNAYTREFEEMWGSHNDNNNSSNSRFGSAKSDNTPHIFNINGRRVECYFSGSDDISGKIENMIQNQTNYSINFCILAFTKFSIENKMHSKYNPPTTMVRGVFDRSTNGNYTNGPVYFEMAGLGGSVWNPTAKVFLDNYSPSFQLHDKYILIDAETPSSNPCVETGSFNFSNAAQFDNDENALIIYDSLVANQYYQDFVKRLTDAGGTIDVQKLSSVVPGNYTLSQNYPNPFNPVTKINFEIPKSSYVNITIYDILGREVATLVNTNLQTGSYSANWDGFNFSSGVYFYTLNIDGKNMITKKMTLIK